MSVLLSSTLGLPGVELFFYVETGCYRTLRKSACALLGGSFLNTVSVGLVGLGDFVLLLLWGVNELGDVTGEGSCSVGTIRSSRYLNTS